MTIRHSLTCLFKFTLPPPVLYCGPDASGIFHTPHPESRSYTVVVHVVSTLHKEVRRLKDVSP